MVQNRLVICVLAVLLALSLAAQSRFDSPTQTVMQPSDQSVTSSTTLTDSSLVILLEANKKYAFQAYLPLNLGGTAPGYKFAWAGPTMSNSSCTPLVVNGSTSTLITAVPLAAFNSVLSGALATSGAHTIWMEGSLEVGGTGGNLKLQFAQSTSSGQAVTLKRGARLTVQEVR